MFKALLALLLLAVGTSLQAAETPSSTHLDPQQARQVAALLQDPQRRQELILTLEAIANQTSTTQGAAPAATTATTPAKTASAPAATEEKTLVPLEANGLIAQTLNRVGRWGDNLGKELVQVQRAVRDLPDWSRASFTSEAGRRALLQAVLTLAVLFTVGLLCEWLARRLLTRPRRALQLHADHADSRAQRDAAQQPPAPPAPVDEDAAAIRPAEPAVALVQTQRDGVDRIEEVPIAPSDSAAPPPSEPDPEPAKSESTRSDRARPSAEEHWTTLRHLPYALGLLFLELLPLLAFWASAAVLIHYLVASDAAQRELVGGFIGAYLTTRLALIVIRLLIDPAAHGIRLLKVKASLACTLLRWLHAFVALVTFGLALAQAADILGATEAGREAIVKLVSLLAHLLVVGLIFQVRRPVAALIAGRQDGNGLLAGLRAWLGQVWAVFAAVFIMGGWTIWALDVEDGLPRLMGFIAATTGIVILGRLTAVFLLGLLGRLFHPEPQEDGTTPDLHLQRYYPLARWLVGVIVTLITVLALFQSWGWNALDWFEDGSIGRSLLSAFLTILIAAIIAVAIWEGANVVVNRRLNRWSERGDTVRAARLRTLLPMLRTGLFILVALIVGLTALSELGVNTTPLLASASIIGVALGFGSQKLVQDFITGIFLLLENAMQVGDWVTVAGVSGTVEYLSIRTVRLRAGDGSLHIVPFSSVSAVNNINRGLGNAAMRISVGYGEDIDRVIAELKDIGAGLRADDAFKDLILADLEIWGVDAVDGAMVTLAGQMRCIDKGRWGVQRELNRRILERFRERGIEIANPRTSLLLPSEAVVVPSAPTQPRPAE
ncbi:mechanosensitive ion channel family protein [Pseudomonas oryzihabitans]|uniref:Small-conductance mechanosensitive channel n=1 Tax=Pseudomonas oryzihabitans TaxID=47885 RepID=A0AAJ2C1E7_9PSED|nr:mechanosensitive ion channel family protein [Pseudomonas psychrotolerans]MDR6236318.1 small-conductance mechanosensitive channel [Pseudomonas psychrotolerans]MDR6354327.1 small-conductance mechanosensitive channel [Pseudomonas psychrotolerans]